MVNTLRGGLKEKTADVFYSETTGKTQRMPRSGRD